MVPHLLSSQTADKSELHLTEMVCARLGTALPTMIW